MKKLTGVSNDKDTVENINRLIRMFFPKGANFDNEMSERKSENFSFVRVN